MHADKINLAFGDIEPECCTEVQETVEQTVYLLEACFHRGAELSVTHFRKAGAFLFFFWPEDQVLLYTTGWLQSLSLGVLGLQACAITLGFRDLLQILQHAALCSAENTQSHLPWQSSLSKW